MIDYRSQLEEDEQLARAIEQSLILESPPRPRYGNEHIYQPIPVYFPMGSRYELRVQVTTLYEFGIIISIFFV